jgi:PAS domain S-box-containing protein
MASAAVRLEHSGRVVIVTDTDPEADLAHTLVWRSDVERICVSDIEKGVEAASAARTNLVILDLAGPEALQAVHRLRQNPATRRMAIVVLARRADLAGEEALLTTGANVVMNPPVDPVLWDARLAELMNVPPRREVRVPVLLHVWSTLDAAAAPLMGTTRNISIHGMLVETPDRIDVGTKLDLEFKLPGSQAELRVLGQVVRVEAAVEGRARIGIKFVVHRGNARERIAAFVQSRTARWKLRPAPCGAKAEVRHQSERLEWEAELRAIEARKTAILESVLECILTVDHQGRIIELNRAAENTFGYSRSELVGRTFVETLVRPAQGESQRADIARCLATGQGAFIGRRVEVTATHANGNEFPVEMSITPIQLEGRRLFTLCVRDITERRQLEEQLRQSQKMEAVGRLAGGVAHDFNNLLNVITGYGELLLRRLAPGSHESLKAESILKAADRAAGLTRQLLAFSRRQVLQPKPFDLNSVVVEVGKMLSRVIGENIRFHTRLDASLGLVKADPGQIEQVLMNLVVNAKDALPGGGNVCIETRNADFDESFALQQLGSCPGPYVMLAVSDDGVGMDEEVQQHIFEPFFTTKEKGKGTGLGLAMVYGIVKQSEGCISVESRPGHGTTFRIYLPRAEGAAPASASTLGATPLRGQETVLLVEDEEMLREVTRELLETGGYRVLAAGSGEEALQISAQHEGGIHLMITDVIMPGMSGPELAKRLATVRPETRVIFVSGYTDEAIGDHGVLDPGTCFLQKPFTPAALEGKIRELLDVGSVGAQEFRTSPGSPSRSVR